LVNLVQSRLQHTIPSLRAQEHCVLLENSGKITLAAIVTKIEPIDSAETFMTKATTGATAIDAKVSTQKKTTQYSTLTSF
jgi:hypothetical protein